jgi:glutathionylspermidine synthase
MLRLPLQPRPNWQATVESQGFHFHSIDDQPYWDESVCYLFTAQEIDQLEAATYALNDMCLQAVQHVIDNNLFHLFQIPPQFVPWVVRSWDQDEFTLYGRFDLAYDGHNPPKLLEYNADTPTSLLEAAVIQWFWFKDVQQNPNAFSPTLTKTGTGTVSHLLNPQPQTLNPIFDQFNSLHDRLIEAWRAYAQTIESRRAAAPDLFNPTIYFSSISGSIEDFMTVTYLRDTATQAGLATEYIPIEKIGFNHARKLFVDLRERPIHNIFKLYPGEWMIREQFSPFLLQTLVNWLESPWKMILSNKAILPILYDLFPDSPHILPASFNPIDGPHVRKPILSREGANVAMIIGGQTVIQTPGPYTGPYVYQQLQPLPDYQGNLPVIGSWLVNGYACGIGIREDTSPITGNTSRFVPHLFVK